VGYFAAPTKARASSVFEGRKREEGRKQQRGHGRPLLAYTRKTPYPHAVFPDDLSLGPSGGRKKKEEERKWCGVARASRYAGPQEAHAREKGRRGEKTPHHISFIPTTGKKKGRKVGGEQKKARHNQKRGGQRKKGG